MYRLFDNPLHLVLLLVIILVVFGAGKLPGVGTALGQSIKEFKKASNEPESGAKVTASGTECTNCHTIIPQDAQFCPSCGNAARPQVTAAATNATSAMDADTLVCSQCGTKNALGTRFCAQCGTAVNVHAG